MVVTDEMLEKALDAYWSDEFGRDRSAVRLALEAVVDEIRNQVADEWAVEMESRVPEPKDIESRQMNCAMWICINQIRSLKGKK